MAKYLLATFSFKPVHRLQKYEPVFTYLRYNSTNQSNLANNVGSIIEKPRWSDEETDKLIKLVEEHGNKWTLFTTHFPGRKAKAIIEHYRYVKYNYKGLTTEEKTVIQNLLNEKNYEEIDWKRIQQSLPNRKPISAIQKYFRNSIDPSIDKGKWTEKETRQLLYLVSKYGKDWSLVSGQMGTRNEDQCSQKYAYEMNMQNVKKGRFSEEEDEALLDAVNKYGTESFNKIKKEANSERSIGQLRYRYYNHLDPEIDKSPWTVEEKNQVFSLYAELKSVTLVKEKLDSKRSREALNNLVERLKKRSTKLNT